MFKIGDRLMHNQTKILVEIRAVYSSYFLNLMGLALVNKNGRVSKKNFVTLDIEYVKNNYTLATIVKFNNDLKDIINE